jgi:hypothetical protein
MKEDFFSFSKDSFVIHMKIHCRGSRSEKRGGASGGLRPLIGRKKP